jgi:hypothetical protein
MVINATDFEFCGEKLSEKGYIIATIENNSTETITGNNIEILSNRNPSSIKDIQYGIKYGDALEIKLQIFKFNCSTQDTSPISFVEEETIKRWLVRPTYNYVNFNNDTDLYFNVAITVNNITIGDDLVGFDLTMKNDSAFGYSGLRKTTIEPKEELTNILDNSSLIGRIYPKFTIQITDTNEFQFLNTSTGERMRINNCTANEKITVDCENKIITTSYTNHQATLAKDFNYVYPTLANDYTSRDNYVRAINGQVTLEYRFRRMVTI